MVEPTRRLGDGAQTHAAMTQETFLCRLDEISDGGARAVRVDVDEPWELVLIRQGECVYGYHNRCSHQARPLDYLPGKFMIDRGCLVCPIHGSTFDVATGACRGGPAPEALVAVPLRVADGGVWLDLATP